MGGEQIPPVDVWSTDALPRDFPRLSPLDFDIDGVHLHRIHYRVIRAAVEEAISAAALLPAPRLPRLRISVSSGEEEGGDGQNWSAMTELRIA